MLCMCPATSQEIVALQLEPKRRFMQKRKKNATAFSIYSLYSMMGWRIVAMIRRHDIFTPHSRYWQMSAWPSVWWIYDIITHTYARYNGVFSRRVHRRKWQTDCVSTNNKTQRRKKNGFRIFSAQISDGCEIEKFKIRNFSVQLSNYRRTDVKIQKKIVNLIQGIQFWRTKWTVVSTKPPAGTRPTKTNRNIAVFIHRTLRRIRRRKPIVSGMRRCGHSTVPHCCPTMPPHRPKLLAIVWNRTVMTTRDYRNRWKYWCRWMGKFGKVFRHERHAIDQKPISWTFYRRENVKYPVRILTIVSFMSKYRSMASYTFPTKRTCSKQMKSSISHRIIHWQKYSFALVDSLQHWNHVGPFGTSACAGPQYSSLHFEYGKCIGRLSSQRTHHTE